MLHSSFRLAMILPIAITALTACGGGSNNSGGNNGPESTYSIGGTVTGALTQGLTLENNGSDSLQVAGISFEFTTQLADGDSYDVIATEHPENQLCSGKNANGTVSGSNVDNIEILCRYWRSATLIENGSSGHARFPQVAADSNGNFLAVWQMNDGTYESVYANYYSASTGSWGTETLIENGDAGHAVTPTVAFDNGGNAIVLWTQNDGTNYNIYANRYTPGTGWGTEELIESGNTGNADSPQVVITNSNEAIAVWAQNDGTHNSIYANRYTPSGGWATEVLIENGNNGHAASPKVAVDSAGNAIVAWSQDVGGYDNIYTNRYTPTGGWGTETLVANGNNGGARDPQIAIDANGNATLVWREYDGTRDSLYASRYTESTNSWGTEVLLESGNNGHVRTPRIAIDHNGNAIAVWAQDEISVRTSIYATRYTASSDSWGAETLIESGEDGSASEPLIAINKEGNAIVVWSQDDSNYDNRLYSNFYNSHTNAWGTEALVENTTVGSNGSRLAMDKDGNATVLTYRYDGTYLNIHANRFE